MGARTPTGPPSPLHPPGAVQRVARRRATSEGSLRWASSADLGGNPVRAPEPGAEARGVWSLRDPRRGAPRPANLSTEIGGARPASRSGSALEPEVARSSHASVLCRDRPGCPVVESRAGDTPRSARGGASRPPPREDGCDPAIARGAGDPSAPGRADDWLLARLWIAGRLDGSGCAHRARGRSESRVRGLGPWPRRTVASVRPPLERAGGARLGSTATRASLSPPDRRCARGTRAVNSRPPRDRSSRRLRHCLQLLPRLPPGNRLLTGPVLAPPASATLPSRCSVTPAVLAFLRADGTRRRGSAFSVRGCGR